MANQLSPSVDEQVAIMACIGHVCVQWALLENNLLGVLASCQNVHIDEAALLFGSLDMRPRLTKAILLSKHHKWKQPLQKRLIAVRDAIDKKKIDKRRNVIVHGVHRPSNKEGHFKLYSPRLSGPAQLQEWSVMDAHKLGMEIQQIGSEVYSIFTDYGDWKFGEHFAKNLEGQLVTTKP